MANKTFEEQIAGLAEKSRRAVENRFSEAQTNQSFTQAFIEALGYDVRNFHEVEVEFTADVGTRKGEKVDYALKKDGFLVMLIEAKSATQRLNDSHKGQLYRYFSVTEARIAVLSNGKEAWFYADLDKDNVMDDEPFFRFNFQNYGETDMENLKKFQKSRFDTDEVIATAREIGIAEKVIKYIKNNIIKPDEEFTKFVLKAVSNGRTKRSEMPLFETSIKNAFTEIIEGEDTESAQSENEKAGKILFFDSHGFKKKYKSLANYKTIIADPRKSVFLWYVDNIFNLGGIDEERVGKIPISFFENKKQFAFIELQERFFNVFLCIGTSTELNDHRDLLRKNSTYTYIRVRDESDHEYLFGLIKEAYDKWR